jgi:hypothetical protein
MLGYQPFSNLAVDGGWVLPIHSLGGHIPIIADENPPLPKETWYVVCLVRLSVAYVLGYLLTDLCPPLLFLLTILNTTISNLTFLKMS